MLANQGYDSDSFRQDLLIHGILPFIPSRKGRKAPHQTDWQRYRERNRIERMLNRLKQTRRIATRYIKTSLSLMSFLDLAIARLWIRSFVNVTKKTTTYRSKTYLRDVNQNVTILKSPDRHSNRAHLDPYTSINDYIRHILSFYCHARFFYTLPPGV